MPLALNKWMLFQSQFQHNPSGIWQSDLKICLEEKGTRKTKSEGKKSNNFCWGIIYIEWNSEILHVWFDEFLTKGYTHIAHTPVIILKSTAPQEVSSGHFTDIPQPLLRNQYCDIHHHRLGLPVVQSH